MLVILARWAPGCFSPLRYARVWAGLAVLSYAAYRPPAHTQSGLLLALEYGSVPAWAAREYYLLDRRKLASRVGPARFRGYPPGARAK